MGNSSTLWSIFFLSMILALLADRQSIYRYGEIGEKIYFRKNRFFYVMLVIVMSVFIGLRRWCNDTDTYLEIYNFLTPSSGSIFQNISWNIGDSPAFFLLNSILKHLGFSSQNYLMFFAFLTIGLYLWFIRKYSSDFWLSVFLFVTMGCYLFAAAGMRQAVAVAIGLIGIDRGLQKKWIFFVLWIFIASLFHPYAVMFLILPLLTYPAWTSRTWILIFTFSIIGFGLQRLFGVILSVTSMMGKTYDDSAFSGEGVNVFRLLVVWAPIVLSFFAKDLICKSKDKMRNLFMNFSILNACIMFVALFGTANYFARLANYFLIFQTLSVPWIISFFKKDDRRNLKLIIIACYMLYFIFANVILTPFNTYFSKMSLIEYFQTAF